VSAGFFFFCFVSETSAKVAPSVAQNLMQLIAIGPGDDERVNDELRRFAVAA
jgi:hypothetical protein